MSLYTTNSVFIALQLTLKALLKSENSKGVLLYYLISFCADCISLNSKKQSQ